MKGLPEALQRQYEYEDPIVRGGKQLLHSPFFKVCEIHILQGILTPHMQIVINFITFYLGVGSSSL